MSYTFRPARRENVPLLVGLAGGTGSGKTLSALKIAKGLAGDQRFAVLDTENGRARHYADAFDFDIADLTAPFRPERYSSAIRAADEAGYGVIVVDSASHEWAGDGGMLDWHDELMGGNESKNLTAWIKPKREHKQMVTRLLQVRAHVILCFRAEPKVEAIRKDGRLEIVPKPSVTGLDGWIPISEKMLPYELTLSLLLMAENPGVPRPIKLEEQHRPFVPLDRPLDEDVGRRLREWATGAPKADRSEVDEVAAELVTLVERLEATDALPTIEAKRKAGDIGWIRRQIAAATAELENRARAGDSDIGFGEPVEESEQDAAQSAFTIPESARS